MDAVAEILTLDEAAKFLKIGRNTLYSLARTGEVPARKMGREWRFVSSALVDWLLLKCPPANGKCWEVKSCTFEERYFCPYFLDFERRSRTRAS